MRLTLPALLVLLPTLLFAGPSRGDAPAPPPQGALYLGQSRMLEAAPPRQLSLNAHVLQFDYQPGGLEIAYAGSRIDTDTVTQFVRLAGVRHGTITTLLSTTVSVKDDGTPTEQDVPYLTSLAGWSSDGRYLLAAQYFINTAPSQDQGRSKTRYVCMDIGQEPPHFAYISVPTSSDAADADAVYWWSPDRLRLLFAAQGVVQDGDKRVVEDSFCGLYDPARDGMKPVALSEKMFTRGWLDDEHILMVSHIDGAAHYFSEDVSDGKQTEIAKPAKMPPALNDLDAKPTTPAVSPKSPVLTLEDEAKTATDKQQAVSAPYHALWVRRTAGPKPMSAMPVGLTPGADDTQARWSPNGQQVAFVAHGDLFVTDLTTRAATAKEKYLAGEPLTCPEERDLAAMSLKEIGLGILQYTQDYDENFPAQNGVNDAIKPYLGPDTLLSVAGHPFVYRAPADLSLAKIDSPADTVLGTINLSCAQVTLFADGHVKALTPAGAAP